MAECIRSFQLLPVCASIESDLCISGNLTEQENRIRRYKSPRHPTSTSTNPNPHTNRTISGPSQYLGKPFRERLPFVVITPHPNANSSSATTITSATRSTFVTIPNRITMQLEGRVWTRKQHPEYMCCCIMPKHRNADEVPHLCLHVSVIIQLMHKCWIVQAFPTQLIGHEYSREVFHSSKVRHKVLTIVPWQAQSE